MVHDPSESAYSAPAGVAMKRCSVCGQDKPADEDNFYKRRRQCIPCYIAKIEERARLRERFPSVAAFDVSDVDPRVEEDDQALAKQWRDGGQALLDFGAPIERICAEALVRHGSVEPAAAELHLEPRQLRAHLSELARRAAKRGFAPGSDMTHATPEGFHVKGVSTLYDGDGAVRAQWVKTKSDEDHKLAALMAAMSGIAAAWKGLAEPVAPPPSLTLDDDLLNVIPMGDPHFGMYAWAAETGADFDLDIAERNLIAAVDHLVDIAPPAKRALIVNLGDFFHADSAFGTTTAGTRVDVDTRWAKVLRVGIRAMRRCIDRALEKHELVHVICEIGNHDSHAAVMLALCLAQYYEHEPRVTIDTSPAKFHWYRFGKVLIGVTHTDTCKPKDLPAVMACDRAEDWGQTLYRYWLTGHVHHDSLKEYPGVTVESFGTLAPKDAWHAAAGYRSDQDMKLIVMHREHGEIRRYTVGIRQLLAGAA